MSRENFIFLDIGYIPTAILQPNAASTPSFFGKVLK